MTGNDRVRQRTVITVGNHRVRHKTVTTAAMLQMIGLLQREFVPFFIMQPLLYTDCLRK